jgi:16S rRNA (uracil1498-N3)-methyltransferase
MNPRFYFPQKLLAHNEVSPPPELVNHLRVLRCNVHDEITLFDGQGTQISAKITEITKKNILLQLQDDLQIQTPPQLKLHLGQALCRFDRMDLILQKAVELNVSEITPLYAERSQGRLKSEALERKMQHWQEIMTSACEQCQQNYLPKINAPMLIQEWLAQTQADLKLQFVLERAISLKSCTTIPESCALLIGPEGGLTPQEENLADQEQFTRITLGERVLRVETAAILALGLINYQFSY